MYTSILQDGSSRVDYPGLNGDVYCVTPDPAASGYVFYAAIPSNSTFYGLYYGTSINTASSLALTSAIYDDISMIQTTTTGPVYFVANVAGTTGLYKFQSGSGTLITAATTAATNYTGSLIAYTKNVSGTEKLYVLNTSTGIARAISFTGNVAYPQISKDSNYVVFSGTTDINDTTGWNLYEVSLSTLVVKQITTSSTLSLLGASYNDTLTKVSCIGIAEDGTSGVYVVNRSTGAITQIASDNDVNLGTYWTNSYGRSSGSRTPLLIQKILKRK